jgi:hypothetical protein
VTSSRSRLIAFFALLALCVIGTAVAIIQGVGGDDGATTGSRRAPHFLPTASATRPVLVYLERPSGNATATGQLELAHVGDGAEPSAPTPSSLRCARTYYAGGRGICVAQSGGFAGGYQAEVYGPDLKVTHKVSLQGVPSRARVSPDGRYGSVTMFVTGHSYAAAGQFSTTTTLIDLRTGAHLGDLEKFTTLHDGKQVTATDVNYWGVTFARDSDVFYATLATGGHTFLIRGSVSGRTARVIHDDVECPSLSPDQTRIAFKKRVGSSSSWRLTVLDLATMKETPLAERASVDDQAEWVDDAHVAYERDGALWTVPADGTGAPEQLVAKGSSPAFARS